MSHSANFIALASLCVMDIPSCHQKNGAPVQDSTPGASAVQRPPMPAIRATTPKATKPPTLENMDTGRDGRVSKAEFLAFHTERMSQIFKSLDRDANGSLEPSELQGTALGPLVPVGPVTGLKVPSIPAAKPGSIPLSPTDPPSAEARRLAPDSALGRPNFSRPVPTHGNSTAAPALGPDPG